MKYRVLDLFSGIGGFSLGLERTGGFETVAFCEIEDYPRRVLAKHWPGVPIYHDVRELTADTLRRDGIAVDVICGGFPCQDLSFAGKRAGLEGARSGLWGEYARLVGELRPRFVLVENVPGLLSLGMGTVLGDLAALGYDATWDCIPAAAVGAPHRRDRVWLIAHTNAAGNGREQGAENGGRCGQGTGAREERRSGRLCHVPHADRQGEHASPLDAEMGGAPQLVADADEFFGDQGRSGDAAQISRGRHAYQGGRGAVVCNTDFQGLEVGQGKRGNSRAQLQTSVGANWWFSEPDVGRVANGVPSRVDRLKGLGNAVVPQIPELIGRAILAAEAA